MTDNIITIYEQETDESKMYDDLFQVIKNYPEMRLWATIGVLDILKMNLNKCEIKS